MNFSAEIFIFHLVVLVPCRSSHHHHLLRGAVEQISVTTTGRISILYEGDALNKETERHPKEQWKLIELLTEDQLRMTLMVVVLNI